MSIPKGLRDNFETLTKAIKAGHAALVECKERETGKKVYAICAVNVENADKESKEGQYFFVPIAAMFTENPYETLEPPTPYNP